MKKMFNRTKKQNINFYDYDEELLEDGNKKIY